MYIVSFILKKNKKLINQFLNINQLFSYIIRVSLEDPNASKGLYCLTLMRIYIDKLINNFR